MNRRDRRAREARVGAAGINVEAMYAWAQSELARSIPPGWGAEKVIPPWTQQAGVCRACGAGQAPWKITMLTKMRPDRKVVLYTFAIFCSECVKDPAKTTEVGNRAFELQ